MRDLKDVLKATGYLTDEKKEFISKAYRFALQIHSNQLRPYSKEPMDVHATRVALILAELGMAHETIAAGLLHHALREGNISKEIIAAKIGSPLVIGQNNDGLFVASDACGIIKHTRNVIFLEDNLLYF